MRCPLFSFCASAQAVPHGRETVSYTHLDVYKRQVRGTFEGADQLLFTGRLSGVPVGSTSVDIAGKTAYIYGVCIAAAHRGQGLGKSLLRGVLAALPAATDKQPALSVEADNAAALGLYTGAGFSLVTEHRYYSAPFAAVRDSLG